MKRFAILFAAVIAVSCSTPARGWTRAEGSQVSGFDGRYFYAEGRGSFEGFLDLKTGEQLIPPFVVKGDYRVGYDLKDRKKIDPDVAKAFVFPAGIPAPTPPE